MTAVLEAELLRTARRGWVHALRWIYAGWILLQFCGLILALPWGRPTIPVERMAAHQRAGEQFVTLLMTQNLLLIALLTPAFVAGAITEEKSRGTLVGLLISFLSPAEIILGKWLARCAQIGMLALTPLPILAALGPFFGTSAVFLLILVFVSFAFILGLGAICILVSVLLRQTRMAIILSLFVTGMGILIVDQAASSNPFAHSLNVLTFLSPLEPLESAFHRDESRAILARLTNFTLGWAALASVCLGLAILLLRPLALRALPASRRFFLDAWLHRPRVCHLANPVTWRERVIARRIPLALGLPGIAVIGIGLAAFASLDLSVVPQWYEWMLRAAGLSMGLFSLVVALRCSGSISGERERQTWDSLLLTPLSSQEILMGKLRGHLGAVWPYVLTFWTTMLMFTLALQPPVPGPRVWIAPALFSACVLAWALDYLGSRSVGIAGVILLAAVSSWVVALMMVIILLANFLFMRFLGAVGLWCSARCQSSWRSLLLTLTLGYAGGVILFFASTPFACFGFFFLVVLSMMMQEITGSQPDPWSVFLNRGTVELLCPAGIALGACVVYWRLSRWLLLSTERYITTHDRVTPAWLKPGRSVAD